jgi:hypothetical protein
MSTRITLNNPTGRKTEARVVSIGNNEYFFSYQTCIAFRGKSGGRSYSIRVPNSWGPTTGKHFKEMHCDRFELVDDTDAFEAIVNLSVGTD